MNQIEFRNVFKRFPSRRELEPPFAVENPNLAIASGEVVAVIGPRGYGKSTLLNMGAGLYGLVVLLEKRVLHYLPKASRAT